MLVGRRDAHLVHKARESQRTLLKLGHQVQRSVDEGGEDTRYLFLQLLRHHADVCDLVDKLASSLEEADDIVQKTTSDLELLLGDTQMLMRDNQTGALVWLGVEEAAAGNAEPVMPENDDAVSEVWSQTGGTLRTSP